MTQAEIKKVKVGSIIFAVDRKSVGWFPGYYVVKTFTNGYNITVNRDIYPDSNVFPDYLLSEFFLLVAE